MTAFVEQRVAFMMPCFAHVTQGLACVCTCQREHACASVRVRERTCFTLHTRMNSERARPVAPRPVFAATDDPRALHFRHISVFAAEVATTCGGATVRRTTRWCRWYRTHEALLGLQATWRQPLLGLQATWRQPPTPPALSAVLGPLFTRSLRVRFSLIVSFARRLY